MSNQLTERMPIQVKAALIVIGIQVAANVYSISRLLWENVERIEHNQGILPIANVLAGFYVIVVVIMVSCIIFARKRFGMARNIIFFMEGLSMLLAVVGAGAADAFSLAGLVLPAIVFIGLINTESKNWFNR